MLVLRHVVGHRAVAGVRDFRAGVRISRRRAERGVVELAERVVQPAFEIGVPGGGEQLADEVPARSEPDGVAVRRGIGEQLEAVVMLRREHEVPRPGLFEQPDPGTRVIAPCGVARNEPVVAEVRAVRPQVVVTGSRSPSGIRDVHGVEVPFRGVFGVAPGGGRIGAPVDEDAELGGGEPRASQRRPGARRGEPEHPRARERARRGKHAAPTGPTRFRHRLPHFGHGGGHQMSWHSSRTSRDDGRQDSCPALTREPWCSH